jgi:hypothetical protein
VYNDIVYDMDLKWWSLEGVYAGLVREQMLTMQAQMACKNGVIGIELNQMRTSVFHTYVMKKQVPPSTRCGVGCALATYTWH